MFDKDRVYSRTEIQSLVGGEIQTYLPQRNNRILAGCFNKELNPNCPLQIQAGSASKVIRKAELIISQPENEFPVFTKPNKKSKDYRYIGVFKCTGGTNAPEILKEAEEKSGRFGQLSYVFDLEQLT
ncbi:MAG: hypothetical protein VCA57_02545 [Pseudomonas sp.]|uniref:hypothetical protein n=1 Tax=Pseudomonas sp. TaxID=306 RepID=UPI0039826629